MDHVKKLRGRRTQRIEEQILKNNMVSGNQKTTLPLSRPLGDDSPELRSMIRMRDQHQYIILEEYPEGQLVAEIQPDFGKMGEVYFWRKEFIEEIKRRGYIIPERKK